MYLVATNATLKGHNTSQWHVTEIKQSKRQDNKHAMDSLIIKMPTFNGDSDRG